MLLKMQKMQAKAAMQNQEYSKRLSDKKKALRLKRLFYWGYILLLVLL
jgi:hypothetical protein